MSKSLEQVAYEQHDEIAERLCCAPITTPDPEQGEPRYHEPTGKVVGNVIQHDVWVPACGGTEREFTANGIRWLYMWNKTTGEHAYYNVTDDVFTDTPDFMS